MTGTSLSDAISCHAQNSLSEFFKSGLTDCLPLESELQFTRVSMSLLSIKIDFSNAVVLMVLIFSPIITSFFQFLGDFSKGYELVITISFTFHSISVFRQRPGICPAFRHLSFSLCGL